MYFFFSSRRRHTRLVSDWSSDVCSSDLSRGRRPVAGGTRIPTRALRRAEARARLRAAHERANRGQLPAAQFRGRAVRADRRRDGDPAGDPRAADARTRPLSPIDSARERWGKGLLCRGSRADVTAFAAALDHGLRPGTTRHARDSAAAVPTGRGRGVVARVRTRPPGRVRSLGSRGQGFWTCPTEGARLVWWPTI